MRLIHISDLHLGKRVYEFSMMEDQKYILKEILRIIDEKKADALIIAGDIYDKQVPPAEAVKCFDDFLTAVAKRKIPAFVISGNHDSAERIAFGSRIFENSMIYVAPVYNGETKPVILEDEYGKVCVYMLPFIRPANVRAVFPEAEIESYDDALRKAVDELEVDTGIRNVIVSHQFVTGAATCESEVGPVGGIDNIGSDIFEKFDYTALGHIHGAQKMGHDRIRYSGTPLKYSFSEASHKKSVTIVNLQEKGKTEISTEPLVPLRDMKEIKGSYNLIASREFSNGLNRDDYYHITLTDEEDVFDAVGRLRTVYPNLMKLDYKNTRTEHNQTVEAEETANEKSPVEYFEELFLLQNNREMNDNQKKIINDIVEKIGEE